MFNILKIYDELQIQFPFSPECHYTTKEKTANCSQSAAVCIQYPFLCAKDACPFAW